MKEIRWWTAEEIEAAVASGERIFPVDLAVRMRDYWHREPKLTPEASW
jgi:hypothetical protein